MIKNSRSRRGSAQSGLHKGLRAARHFVDYQLLVFMVRLGLIQPAQVRVRAYR